MSSTIFAIYCYMFFYSRKASALRIAEVDHDAAKCEHIVTNSKTKYICKEECIDADNSPKATQQPTSNINLDTCVGLIGTSGVTVVSHAGTTATKANNAKCVAYKSIKVVTCGGSKVKFWAAQGSIFGDPHVVNMAGEKFDILTSGTFSLLSLTRATEEDLAINGTVVRFGTKCGQSFIDDLELTGGWIREFYNTKTLKVRAIQDTPQTEALQINFGQKWQPLADLQEMARVKKTPDAIELDLSKLTVEVSAGKHKHHGWNFLNLDVQGLATLGDNIHVGGLLGYDDHTQVSKADADCAMFASAAETDMQDQQSCLSYLKAN